MHYIVQMTTDGALINARAFFNWCEPAAIVSTIDMTLKMLFLNAHLKTGRKNINASKF